MCTITMTTVKEAKNSRKVEDLVGKVTNKGEPRQVNTKHGPINVCDAQLSDGEDTIKLTLWGDEINKVNNDDMICIKNGFTNSFKGEVSVSKGKFGTLEVVQP